MKISLLGGVFIDLFVLCEGELIIWKDVNSVFIGIMFELELCCCGIMCLVVVGFFINFCVEMMVCMVGNMVFDIYLIYDVCVMINYVGIDGVDYDLELIYCIFVISMNGEFCMVIDYL